MDFDRACRMDARHRTWFLAAALTLAAYPLAAQSIRLNGRLVQPLGGDVTDDYQIDPSGTRVVFRGDLAVDGVLELYSALLDGSGLTTRLAPFVNVDSFALGAAGR